MFHSARIRLTAWYLLIIMLVSISFSAAIYKILTLELDRVERVQRFRIEHSLPERFRIIIPPSDIKDEFPRSLLFDPEVINETKNRLKLILVVINFTIFGASAAAGYFLAGRTLKPISKMLDEQKRFVADASHELRTPLTAVKTEIEVSLRDKKIDLKSAKKLLLSNLEEINKLKSLTDYFLTLDKYQNLNTKFNFEIFNLSQAVEEAVNRFSVIAKDKKIEIVKNLNDISLEADKISITELITILLDNAIKYSHENNKVIISMETTKNNAVVIVRDFGIGIKSTEIPYIFNRFYRADLSRTKNVIKGYGLGLSIAKSITDLHKGKISVESTVEKGSTFTVLLPLKQINFVIPDLIRNPF